MSYRSKSDAKIKREVLSLKALNSISHRPSANYVKAGSERLIGVCLVTGKHTLISEAPITGHWKKRHKLTLSGCRFNPQRFMK